VSRFTVSNYACYDRYGSRLGVIYIVHTNVFFWLLYVLLIRPFLGLFQVHSKVVVVETVEDLLPYFDADQLFLLSYNESSTVDERRTEALAELQSIESSLPHHPTVLLPAAIRSTSAAPSHETVVTKAPDESDK
jgi:hypothetical protein